MKITTIGAALIDIFFESSNFQIENRSQENFLCFPYGHKIEVDDHQVSTGGAATNVAVALARRGHNVSLIAEIGQDNFASIIKNELIGEKVDTHYLIQESLEKTGVSVILRGTDGGRTVMVSRSASSMLDDYDIPIKYLSTRDWIHLSSVGGNLNALSEIWQVFDLAPLGFSWNPGSKELELLANGALTLPRVGRSVFFVNLEEWAIIANIQSTILQAFTYVIVTAGRQGGTLYANGVLYTRFEPKNPMPAFEETGAGDAFASAFISTLIYGRTLEEALLAAKNNSDAVIRHLGAKKGLLSF